MPVTVTASQGAVQTPTGHDDTELDPDAANGQFVGMMIYKIFREAEWATLLHDGETPGAPVDVADGFVHLSTAEQVLETATRHFEGEVGLWLLALDADRLDPLKWEPSRGGARFPHLYRPLRLDDVTWARRMGAAADGGHILPPGVR